MRKITASQLRRAVKTAPREIHREGKIFLTRGLSEYKRVAVQESPWRVGQKGGGVPREKGNLRERHRTAINGLEGRFGVGSSNIKYAGYVHQGTRNMEARPWLDYARQKGESAVEKHYNEFLDNILIHIAT